MPALARIWDGEVVPLDVDRLARDADVVFLALPEAASAELAPQLLERGVRVIDLSGAFRIRAQADRAALVSRDGSPSRGHGLRDDGGEPGGHPAGAPRVESGLLSDGRAPRARAAGGRRPARRPGLRRRQVGHLGRGQDAVGPHAFLGESRQRRGVLGFLASAHRRDRTGARRAWSRSCRTWCRSIAAFSRRSTYR